MDELSHSGRYLSGTSPYPRPWLIVPIEIKGRELDAKVYMACAAAEAGFRVMLGEQNSLLRQLSRLPRGFYLDKSVTRPKVKPFARLKKLGFRVVAWCEEGLVYCNREAYVNERVATAAFNEVDAFFAWGQVQAQDMRTAVNDVPSRIVETGNPRFDLLRPSLREFYRTDAEDLHARLGNFIIINTNFGRYNHYLGRDAALQNLRTRGVVRNDEDAAYFRGWIDFIGQVFHSFEEMLPRLAKAFPNRNIVLRPHPSENHDTWRRIASGIPNVQVIYEGGSIPWLLASALSIHNSCTTGLEGALMDRPALAYRKVRSEIYDSFLPNRVSTNVSSFEELATAVESVFSGNYRAPLEHDPAVRADVARYIASADGPSATDRILSYISALPEHPPGRGTTTARILDQGEQALRAVTRKLLVPLRQTGGYAKQKFPGLEPREVEALVHRYRALTGRFSTVQVRPAHNHAVTIEASR